MSLCYEMSSEREKERQKEREREGIKYVHIFRTKNYCAEILYSLHFLQNVMHITIILEILDHIRFNLLNYQLLCIFESINNG